MADLSQVCAHHLLTNSAKLVDLGGTHWMRRILEIPVFPLLRLLQTISPHLTTQALPRNGIQEVVGASTFPSVFDPVGSTS